MRWSVSWLNACSRTVVEGKKIAFYPLVFFRNIGYYKSAMGTVCTACMTRIISVQYAFWRCENMVRFRGVYLMLGLLLMVTGCSLAPPSMREFVPEAATENTAHVSIAQEKEYIYVYICGCVRHPDVYRLHNGSRAIDAVKAAGGFTGDASKEACNLAEELEDGMQITIPSVQEESPSDSRHADTGGKSQDGLVNINLATAQELTALPGIGTARAEEIVSYRNAHGDFSSIEDIKNVSGIGDGIYTRIQDMITVS